MRKLHPASFPSFEAWDTYCTCLNKVKPHDELYICMGLYGISSRLTNDLAQTTVIGVSHILNPTPWSKLKKFSITLLVGSNIHFNDFWPMSDAVRPKDYHLFDEDLFRNFRYGFYVYSEGDVKIAKIVPKNR